MQQSMRMHGKRDGKGRVKPGLSRIGPVISEFRLDTAHTREVACLYSK
jgi:hypothetical protein